ncbi:hypothetical protein COM24_31690, partial [Bacillus toyonensis]
SPLIISSHHSGINERGFSFENPLFYCCILIVNTSLKKEGIIRGIYSKSTNRKTYFHSPTFT